MGHIQSNCLKDKISEPKSVLTNTESSISKGQSTDYRQKPKCTYCDKVGHVESTCFKKMSDDARKVNLASETSHISTPMEVHIKGQKLIALFDSGADRSLIQKSLSFSMPGKSEDYTLMLKGFGMAVPVVSYQRITTTCKVNDIFLEINFHIVEDHEIPCEVLIGSDLIKLPGLEVKHY